jgi:AraC-like DNA-binding protein
MARPRRFDAPALHAALDARRRERGLSWKQLTEEVWEQSAALNARRPHDHPLAITTFSGMAKRGAVGAPHALFMLRWLGQPPEAFLGIDRDWPDACNLPEAGTDRRLRWDLKELYRELNLKRQTEGLTWAALAEELGCSPSQLTGLRAAKFGLNMNVAMAITQWLHRPAAHFIHAAEW